MYVNRGPEDGNYVWAHRGSSTITLTEIARMTSKPNKMNKQEKK